MTTRLRAERPRLDAPPLSSIRSSTCSFRLSRTCRSAISARRWSGRFSAWRKRKRLKPIEYVSPNGEVFVNVFPNAEFGMATIWDADILIWAASS